MPLVVDGTYPTQSHPTRGMDDFDGVSGCRRRRRDWPAALATKSTTVRNPPPPPPSRLGQATNLLYFRLVLGEDVDNPVAGSHNMFPELLVILDRGLSICRGQDKAKLLLVPWTIIPVGDSR